MGKELNGFEKDVEDFNAKLARDPYCLFALLGMTVFQNYVSIYRRHHPGTSPGQAAAGVEKFLGTDQRTWIDQHARRQMVRFQRRVEKISEALATRH